MSADSASVSESDSRWLEIVREKVRGIRFGSVQITVHDGRVTQVEAIEKTRIAPERPDAASRSDRPRS